MNRSTVFFRTLPDGPSWTLFAPTLLLVILPVGRTTPLRSVLLFLTLVSAWWAWRTRMSTGRPRMPGRGVSLVLGAWLLLALASCAWSIAPGYSLGEWRNEVFYPLTLFVLFAVLTPDLATWQGWRRVLLVSATVMAIATVFSSFAYDDWLRTSFFGDRNAYSTYVTLVFPVFLYSFAYARSAGSRVLVALAMALLLLSGALTLNRNMWFAIALESALLVFLLKTPDRSARASLPWKRLAIAAAVVVAFIGIFVIVDGAKRTSTVSLEEVATAFLQDPRLEIWVYAGQRIMEMPWFGHGYGRGILRGEFVAHFDNPLKWHGHNVVLNYGLEMGLLGMLLIVAVFIAVAALCLRVLRAPALEVRRLGLWGLMMLVGILVKMMTDDILVRENSLLFWSMLGMMWGVASRQPGASHTNESLTRA